MKELKFRAWSIKKCKWLDIDTLYCANGKVCGVVYGGVVYDTEDVVLEQYTGLKDKNGKEIYEGDIVSIRNKNHKNEYDSGVVGFRKGAFRCPFFLGKYQSGQVEVIGNIHENKELWR